MDALQDVLQHVGKSSAVVFQHPLEVMTVTAWTLLLMSRSEAGPVNLPIKKGSRQQSCAYTSLQGRLQDLRGMQNMEKNSNILKL